MKQCVIESVEFQDYLGEKADVKQDEEKIEVMREADEREREEAFQYLYEKEMRQKVFVFINIFQETGAYVYFEEFLEEHGIDHETRAGVIFAYPLENQVSIIRSINQEFESRIHGTYDWIDAEMSRYELEMDYDLEESMRTSYPLDRLQPSFFEIIARRCIALYEIRKAEDNNSGYWEDYREEFTETKQPFLRVSKTRTPSRHGLTATRKHEKKRPPGTGLRMKPSLKSK